MSGKFNTLPLGDNPTLIGRVQRFVGNTLFNLGFRRLGWDIGSYSWSKRHLCGCGLGIRLGALRPTLTH